MVGLWPVVSGLQCVLLQTDSSPATSSLHRQLVLNLSLTYIAIEGFYCPRLLLYDSLSSVEKPPWPGFRFVLVTWQPPSDDDLEIISERFNRSTFLWLSEFNGVGEKYFVIKRGVLKKVNESKAAKFFKLKRFKRIPNYKQRIFTIATTNYTAYSQVAQSDEGGHFKWTKGFQLMYLFLLCETVGLRPVVTAALGWDRFYSNGSLREAGLQSEAISGNVDASVGGIWYRANIISIVDFLAPWERGCFRYLVPQPKRVHYDWNLYLDVFNAWVWVVTILSVVVVSILLILVTKISPNPKLQGGQKSLCSTLFFVISVLVQEPQVRQNWRGPQVPIFYSWVWATMVLSAAFAGTLSAMLVIPSYEDRPKTIRDLLDRGYTYGSPYSTSGFQTIFEDNMSDDWKTWTYDRFRLSKTFEETVERMKTGKFLVSGEEVHNIFFFLSSPLPPKDLLKKFETSNQCHQNFLSGPIFPPGSTYSAALNKVNSRLQAGGISSYVIRNHLKMDPALRQFIPQASLSPSRNSDKTARSLGLGSVSSAFVILVMGILLATCSFLVELILGQRI